MKQLFKLELILSIVLFAVLLLIAFNTTTTGDAGDSILHYLYSHYAFEYPGFFLDHWAKPFFVFCSAPFAQFGFKGIIVFNAICATLSALYAYYTARNLGIKNSWLVFVLLFSAPLYFQLIFSGLTEYLFGLLLIVGIYLFTKSKYTFALIIISFLPLVRSEGLLILGVFGFFVLLKKQYKLLPFLITGQAIYSIVGAFYYKDLLWVFNKIPYANIGSPYGSGGLFDFVHRLNYVIEKPIYLLLVIGSLGLIYSLFRKGLKQHNDIKFFLIFGSFAVLFVAHSVFWWLGIFNSMGLPRVLNAVVPLIAIIALMGVETITSKIQKPILNYVILSLIALSVAVYPFTNRPEGVVYGNQLLVLEENNLISEEVAPYIQKELPDYSNSRVYFSHPYLSLALNIDYFDKNRHKDMQHLPLDELENGTIIIWDEWFSVMEGRIQLEDLRNDDRFELKRLFERKDGDRVIQFGVFRFDSNEVE